jgi:hypothetical protein
MAVVAVENLTYMKNLNYTLLVDADENYRRISNHQAAAWHF